MKPVQGGQPSNGPPADVRQATLNIPRVGKQWQFLAVRINSHDDKGERAADGCSSSRPQQKKKTNPKLEPEIRSSKMDYFQVFEKLQAAVGKKKTLTACDKAERDRHENKVSSDTEKPLSL